LRSNEISAHNNEPPSSGGEVRIERSRKDAKRNEWTNRLDFLFSIIGFSVDLSNIFKFPYLCYKNGGGAFLIPYFFMLTFCALPLFYLELVIGQYFREGCLSIWKVAPFFRGELGRGVC
ncbi:unnamed protein product, partial [Protopolystoma xenopodis]